MPSNRDNRRNARDSADEYQSYVVHPKYGRGPRYTGSNPSANQPFDSHWHSRGKERIPDTAIEANGSKQKWVAGTNSYGFGLYVRYYFDVRRICRDCKRPFIFFAEEQKYWYEKLGIPLEVDCVRCYACRRKRRGIGRARRRYNELIAVSEPTSRELIELVSLSINMITDGEFSAHPRTFGRIRMWLNRLSKDSAQDITQTELTRRLTEIEESQREAIRRLVNEINQEDTPE